MNVWRLITHHEDRDTALSWSRRNGRIAIGWGKVGDIRDVGFASADEITAAIRREYPNQKNPYLGGSSLWDFYARMKKSDLVILRASKASDLAVEVEGDYEWTEESPLEGHYQHQRRVVIRRDLSPEDLWSGAASGQNIRSTLIRCELSLVC